MENEYDVFVSVIRLANDRLIVNIPKNVATFAGLEAGQLVKVMIKKEVPKEKPSEVEVKEDFSDVKEE